ncbi:MAG: NlpC/P60 family protein [Pseudonocardiaceae bacterium]
MRIRSRRCSARRVLAVVLLTTMALLEQSATAGALPSPPPNPGDDELDAERDRVDTTTGLIGLLADQVAAADAALLAVQSEVALKREETNKALIDLEHARVTAADVRIAADTARAAAEAAAVHLTEAQRLVDRFAAASYRQGSTIGSLSAFLGSPSPQDLLAKGELLDAVGGWQLDALENVRRTRAQAADKDARARDALALARSAERAPAEAEGAAETTYQAVIVAESAQSAQTAALQARESDLERRLAEAQQALAGLLEGRYHYRQWTIQGDRAPTPRAAESGSAGLVQDVIDRAMAQRGVRYSWGGGDADGPTTGIRDGGVGDSHGDYRTVGFDCSGLIIYAFAAALGYSLPHYSGAQYEAGRHVSVEHKRPGDLLFWGSSGRIHHVALYLGNEQMIEAPYSGSAVRVTAVRYGGLLPSVTRIL